jgi:hypothetical protein
MNAPDKLQLFRLEPTPDLPPPKLTRALIYANEVRRERGWPVLPGNGHITRDCLCPWLHDMQKKFWHD